jgi:multisubunit Na+/H+ antiporter MnhC subunit
VEPPVTQRAGSRPLPWLVSSAAAFVLTLAALLAPPGAPDVASPARVALDLPKPLVAAVVLTLVIVEIVVLAFALLSGRRGRKRKEENEFELSYERPPVSPWIAALLLVPTFLLVGVIVYLVWHGVPMVEQWSPGRAATSPGAASLPTVLPPGVERPFASIPILTWSVASIAVLVAAGSLALMLWLFLGHRLGPSGGGATEAGPSFVEAIDESLGDLRRERDPRAAIVKCYRRFEQAMARARVPRRPWETPVEYMHAALSRLALPARAVQGLTDLFEIARYSDHPVGAPEHEAAWTCLTEIRDALERRIDALAT